jgi:hypothetical protein
VLAQNLAMTERSPRLLKKLHRRWLADCAIDATHASYWRRRLLDSTRGDVFELSRADLSGLSRDAALAVQKFGLRISATVVDARDAEPWLSENGCVVFKFWATEFPTVSFFTGNNPAIR